MAVMIIHRIKLNVMKNLFRVHPSEAKNPYRTPVIVMDPAYNPRLDPMSINCQNDESVSSQF